MPDSYPKIDGMDYFTNRSLENEKGEKKGKLLMYRVRGEEVFSVKLKCPFCETIQEQKIVFKKRPYKIKCKQCENIINVPKLKK